MKNQKKIKMSKGKLWVLGSLFVLAVAAFVAGCGTTPETKDITVEVGTEFDLYSLLGEEDIKSYREFSITQGDKKLTIDSNTVVFPSLGEYTVNYSTSKIWKVKTQDTTAPVVHITGSYLNLWSTDEVYLPAIVVNDNCDGNIQNYTVEVTSGGKTIPLSENNSFIATNAGPYTVKASAKDSSGNVGSASKDFTVLRKAEIIVKSGATVAVSDLDYRSALETDKEYTFAYSVRVNGEDAPDVSATDGFTVADNSYYEVIATATNNADSSDVTQFYTLFREEHVKMISFTGWTSADVAGTYNLICNPYPATERTVEQSGGGYAMKAEIKDVHKPDQEFNSQEDGWDYILAAWTLRAWNLPESDYKMSFDVTVGGKIKSDSPDDRINVKIGGFENENKEYVVNGRKGEYAEATFHYSSDTTSIYDLWATKDSVFFCLYFLRVQVESISYTLDNVRLTPKTAPAFTVENESVNIAAGENIPLSAGDLGIAATDFFGDVVKELKCTKILFGATDKTDDWAECENIVSPQEGIYLLTYTAVDYYGNIATKQITVTVGDKDYYAPSFSEYDRLNSVEKNTEITLGANGIANFVTVTDDAGFDLTYRVVKYGAQGAEDLTNATKFTVQGGEYYEVYMTATDKSDNQNTSYGYAVFAADDIVGRLDTLSGHTAINVGDGTSMDLLKQGGELLLEGYKFPVGTWNYGADEFGNYSLKLKAVTGNNFELMFAYDQTSNIMVRFSVRLEGDTTGLSGELFTICGTTIAAENIGKDYVISTKLAAYYGNNAAPLTVDTNGIKDKDIWVVIDNIEIFTPSAPALSAENDSIKQDSGTGITFTAEALGMIGEDYLGNELADLKVTEVKFNDEVNAAYTDGYELTAAPDGVYKIKFTGTDRYGMTADLTITVKVGSTPPEITATRIDNYVAAATVITLTKTGIANYLTVTAEDDYTLSYRVMKNGAEEVANASSITVGAGEYYEVYVTATSGSKTSNGYILFAESSLNGVLKTLNGGTEVLNSGVNHCKQNGQVSFSSNAGKMEIVTNPDGSASLCLGDIKSGLQFFLPYSEVTGVNVSFTLRIEGEFEGSGDLLTIGSTTVTTAQVGQTIAVNYDSASWFGGDNIGFSVNDHFTLDSVTVSELLSSSKNVKIYIDNIIVRAQ